MGRPKIKIIPESHIKSSQMRKALRQIVRVDCLSKAKKSGSVNM